MFNSAQDYCMNLNSLNKIISKPTTTWMTFSNEEFKSAINKYNTLSTSGLDHISWKYLKSAVKNKKYFNNFINNTNICIGYWPAHFKESSSIIILRPNKVLYDSLKMFWPILLLNTLGKLIKKVIGKYIQFHIIFNNFIHPNY